MTTRGQVRRLRVQPRKAGNRVVVFSRSGHGMTRRFAMIRDDLGLEGKLRDSLTGQGRTWLTRVARGEREHPARPAPGAANRAWMAAALGQ
jgi:hypothetical protein